MPNPHWFRSSQTGFPDLRCGQKKKPGHGYCYHPRVCCLRKRSALPEPTASLYWPDTVSYQVDEICIISLTASQLSTCWLHSISCSKLTFISDSPWTYLCVRILPVFRNNYFPAGQKRSRGRWFSDRWHIFLIAAPADKGFHLQGQGTEFLPIRKITPWKIETYGCPMHWIH